MSIIEIQGDHGFIIPVSELVYLPLGEKNEIVDCFSLSGCIYDIITGNLDISNLGKIISGTCIASDQEFEDCVYPSYTKFIWKTDPTLAKLIFYDLFHQGRIIQPRLENKRVQLGSRQYTKVGWYEDNIDHINRNQL